MASISAPAGVPLRAPQPRRPPPLPPEWVHHELRFDEPHLWRFVILSILLHVLAILLFGAPAGGSREGRAMWGSLQVVIRNALPQTAPLPAAPETPQPERTRISPAIEKVVPSVPPEAPAPAEPQPTFPPLLDRLPTPDIQLETIPPLVVPPPADSAAPLPTPAPAPPASAAPREAPPIPSGLLQPLPALRETAPLPTLDRVPEIRVPEIRIPAPAPQIPASLLQPMPQVNERTTLPALERIPAFETPAAAPVPPAATAVPPAATPVEKAPSAARPPPAESARPDAPPVPGRATPDKAPASAPPPADSLFKRREDPPAYDPTKPTLDADALRKRAGELGREGIGQRALLPFPMPPVAKPKSKLESAIENARKPDCREAYKALGLAAVVPLIANEFGEGNCRW